MTFNDLNSIDGIQFMPIAKDKRPLHQNWQAVKTKYDFTGAVACGMVCGSLSRNVEAIDFDLKYDLSGTLMSEYIEAVNQIAPELLNRLVVQKTMSGGFHIIYRCSEIEGNQKLANRATTIEEKEQTYNFVLQAKNVEMFPAFPDDNVRFELCSVEAKKAMDRDKVRVLIETRGEKGQIACYPTPGYEMVQGSWYDIPEITPQERSVLFEVAVSFNSYFPKKQDMPHQVTGEKRQKGKTPSEDFNDRGDVVALLCSHGWTVTGKRGGKTLLKRPGQTSARDSGNYDDELRWFSVFSTSTEFESQKPYKPYAVFAMLECGGDYSLVTKKLADMGYGDPLEKQKENTASIPSIINMADDEDLSFLAGAEDMDEYLHQWRTGTFQMGLPTGIPDFDKYFRFKEGNLVMINGIDNVGKALCIKTPIPTPDGWKTMEEIHVGDDVFGDDGKICQVIAETEIMYNRKSYVVSFSNGEKITCCEDHLWTVVNYNGDILTLSTKDILKKGVFMNHKQKRISRFSLKMTEPLVLPKRSQWVINPYTLGCWLGDGTSKGNKITCGFEDWEETKKNLQNDGNFVKEVRYSSSYSLAIYTGDFTTRLRILGIYDNKHIPSDYLRGSLESRIELLRGLMDTDGYASKDGRLEYCTKSKKLAEGVMELLSTLGIKYSCSEKIPSIKGRKMDYVAYYINFSCDKDKFSVFRLERKKARESQTRKRGKTIQIVDISPIESVPVKCIEVNNKSKLYLCGKTMIPTHNSVITWYTHFLAAFLHNWKGIIYSSENKVGAVKKKIMEFYWCKTINTLTEEEYVEAENFFNEHFRIIKNKNQLFNYQDIINMVTKILKGFDAKMLLIDPYNSLKVESSNPYTYHYEAASTLKLFGEEHNLSIYINAHAGTSAAKKVDKDGNILAPDKADTEMGVMFANKADDFLTVHRLTQHDSEYMYTELHVRKIKELETGGRPTPKAKPIYLRSLPGLVGFEYVHQKKQVASGFNAVKAQRDLKNGINPFYPVEKIAEEEINNLYNEEESPF